LSLRDLRWDFGKGTSHELWDEKHLLRKDFQNSERLTGRSFASYLQHLAIQHSPESLEEARHAYRKQYLIEELRNECIRVAKQGYTGLRTPYFEEMRPYWTLENLEEALGVQVSLEETNILKLEWHKV
jgi:hypothetical protein